MFTPKIFKDKNFNFFLLLKNFKHFYQTLEQTLDAINNFDGGVRQVVGVNGTAGIFATYPADYLTIGGGLWDQV